MKITWSSINRAIGKFYIFVRLHTIVDAVNLKFFENLEQMAGDPVLRLAWYNFS
jgi:hypothetical protein